MNSILVTLVDESVSLPSQVIDIIIAQFLRAVALAPEQKSNVEIDPKQSTLVAKELPPAYRMAKFICDQCPSKMARYISQYFNEVIIDASPGADNEMRSHGQRKSNVGVDSEDEDGGPSGPTEADMSELIKAHRLLRELWRASPSVLQNVIPQLEAELSAENVRLRLLATETLGDIVSGIGAAGPPRPPPLDPAAYPPLRLVDNDRQSFSSNAGVLMTPLSPESFSQTYHSVYQGFVQRSQDKSAVIRAGWATAAGRILVTSAGGIGLSREEEKALIDALAEKLSDSDDRVRISAIRAVATFSFNDFLRKLAPHGNVNKVGSILCNLCDRFKDNKHNVRVESMTLLAKLWGVGAAEIEAAENVAVEALAGIPTRIFEAMYVNQSEITALMDRVTFEQLIPLSYPATKSKSVKAPSADAQTANGDDSFDADRVRTERILTLVKTLNAKAKAAFFKLQARQPSYRQALTTYLALCEKYNGSVTGGNTAAIKSGMNTTVAWLVHDVPDKARATLELWKFAKLHDRRSYQLLRFAMAPESDFKTVHKAIKEFTKRMESNSAAPAGIMDLMHSLIYRSGSLMYNKSHLPSILAFSRNDLHGFGETAHEMLKQISKVNPQAFKAQIKELCKDLEDDTPTASRANELGSVQTLKACAGYARKYPEEIPTDRDFMKTLLSYAQFGRPAKAAKYAVSILLSTGNKKEMHAQDLIKKATKGWQYGSEHFLAQLATISQITLLAPSVTEDLSDEILDITTKQLLLKVRTPASPEDPKWLPAATWDEECEAKVLALKCLVNRIRAAAEDENVKEMAVPVYKLLNTLVYKEGELDKQGKTPRHHKSRLRLTAAQLLLKLSCIRTQARTFDELLTAEDFNNLACVAQDPHFQVRLGFIEKLKRYLVSNRLPARFYSIVFLVAFEPDTALRVSTTTWIKSRKAYFDSINQRAQMSDEKATMHHTLEALLPRFLSLLAHHPDYSAESDDLVDTARYIIFYLNSVASPENLSLIYKYAERVKQVRDAISPDDSERLYVLSDLCQAIIKKWADKKGWTIEAYASKVAVSKDLFAALGSHEDAQRIAEKNYLNDDMDELLAALMKKVPVSRKVHKPQTLTRRKLTNPQHKRQNDDGDRSVVKKVKPDAGTKTPKPRPAKAPTRSKPKVSRSSEVRESSVPESERRRSGRAAPAARKSYADRDDSEDDEEMLNGVSKWEYDDGRVEGDGDEQPSDEEDVEMDGNVEADDAPEAEADASEASDVPAEEEANEEEEGSADDKDEEPALPLTNNKSSRRGATKPTSKPSPAPAPKAKPQPKALEVRPTRTRSTRGK